MRIGSYDLPKAPKLTKRRKTQAQRDEEIVGANGPYEWDSDGSHGRVGPGVYNKRKSYDPSKHEAIGRAMIRIMNRLHRIARASGGS